MLATGRASGAIDILNPCTAEVLGSIPLASPPAANGSAAASAEAAAVRGLHWVWGGAAAEGAAAPPTLLSVTQGGAVRLHAAAADGDSSSWQELRAWQVPADVCCTVGVLAGQPREPEQIPQRDFAAAWHAGARPLCTLCHPCGCCVPSHPRAASNHWHLQDRLSDNPLSLALQAYDPGSSTLAVGCQGAELRLFDAATGQLSFAAKGGKPSKLGLVDRPWNTALCFLPDAAAAAAASGDGSGSSGHVVLAGTGHHKLRLYDVRAGKRPQADLSFGEARITALAPEADGGWRAAGQGGQARVGRGGGGCSWKVGEHQQSSAAPGRPCW